MKTREKFLLELFTLRQANSSLLFLSHLVMQTDIKPTLSCPE